MIRMTPAKRRLLSTIAHYTDQNKTVGHFDPMFSQSERKTLTNLKWDGLIEYGNIDFRAGYVVTEAGREILKESK